MLEFQKKTEKNNLICFYFGEETRSIFPVIWIQEKYHFGILYTLKKKYEVILSPMLNDGAINASTAQAKKNKNIIKFYILTK